MPTFPLIKQVYVYFVVNFFDKLNVNCVLKSVINLIVQCALNFIITFVVNCFMKDVLII